MNQRVLLHEVKGQGEPIVLVPGGLSGWLSWIPHAERLSTNRKVIRVQLRSIELAEAGESFPEDYGVLTEREALHATVNELGLDSFDLAGWSHGGLVSLVFALEYPERVRTLTLIEPGAFWVLRETGHASDALAGAEADDRSLSGQEITIRDLKDLLVRAGLGQPGDDFESLPQWPVWVRNRQVLSILGTLWDYTDSLERLRALKIPVLAVKGTDTSELEAAVVDDLAATVPRGRLLELPGGHACHIENIDRFLEELTKHTAVTPTRPFERDGTRGGRIMGSMETVTSRDGTPIAYERGGEGPPLVLVHGTTSDHLTWEPVLPELQKHFTVYAIDRRGRGESGGGGSSAYDIEREFEDVVAVIDSIDGPADLFGHSYGAICGLEAALRSSRVRRLILYEGTFPVPEGTELYPPEALDRVRSQLEAGDREGALTTFYRDIVLMSPEEIEMLRSLPVWPARVALAPTIPHEMRALESYVSNFDPARLGNLRTPTLLLLGGDSPALEKAAAEALDAALPDSQIVVMPHQGHLAHRTAPGVFVREVVQFLMQA